MDPDFDLPGAEASAATTPPRASTIFSKRKPKALSVCTGPEEVAQEAGSTMWSPSTGIDDLLCGVNGAPASSLAAAKPKTPSSLNALLEGQQGFVDAGTPNLKMSDMLHPTVGHKIHSNTGDVSLESDHTMSAAEVASMMCFTPPTTTPPKSSFRNPVRA